MMNPPAIRVPVKPVTCLGPIPLGSPTGTLCLWWGAETVHCNLDSAAGLSPNGYPDTTYLFQLCKGTLCSEPWDFGFEKWRRPFPFGCLNVPKYDPPSRHCEILWGSKHPWGSRDISTGFWRMFYGDLATRDCHIGTSHQGMHSFFGQNSPRKMLMTWGLPYQQSSLGNQGHQYPWKIMFALRFKIRWRESATTNQSWTTSV